MSQSGSFNFDEDMSVDYRFWDMVINADISPTPSVIEINDDG